MANELADALKGLKPEDIEIDELGRIVITDPELVQRLSKLGLRLPVTEAGIDNVGCCKNGYQCGCTGEAVDFGKRIVGART